MKQKRFLGLYCLGVIALALLGFSPGMALGQPFYELKLSSGTVAIGSSANITLSMTALNTAGVQGFVAAADWNVAVVKGTNLQAASGAGEALNGADVIVPRIEPGYFVLGVVMDNDGVGGELIPAGTDLKLATLTIEAAAGATAGQSTALSFRDTTYNTVSGGPLLDNIVVVGGLSIGKVERLTLTNGSATVIKVTGRYTIQSTAGARGAASVTVPVILSGSPPLQGYVVAIAHNPAEVTLTAVTNGSSAAAAEFVSADIFPTGGTLGVVMDYNPPFDNQVAANGEIAKYTYSAVSPPQSNCPTTVGPDVVSNLSFVDNVLGSPPLENVTVIDGLSENPELVNGSVTFRAPDCIIIIPGEQEFACGGPLVKVQAPGACGAPFVLDANGNFIPDEEGRPAPVRGSPGEKIAVGFYYRSPSTGIVDENSPNFNPDDPALNTDKDDVQGLSMAICYSQGLSCLETFSIAGTITEAVGAEFVTVHCNNTTRELIIGILVDALPPFDGQTLPPTANLLRVISVDFQIDAGADCKQSFPIQFCDGAKGRGQVPIKNLISVMNFPISPKLCNCEVKVNAEAQFVRGDCNFAESFTMPTMAVDISDAAAVISFLFLTGTWKFHPKCLDACDANDDARIDLADAVAILRYLFKFAPPLPAPGPTALGPDPTGDKLDCKGGSICN
ncbi:MAG: hypothetical protein HY717_01940 [Planctomycetes bacterium]|nr:hypothetical protein [Planctomycetota bacterium]